MARINNLTNFLTDVAAAIKEKKGSVVNIPAANFDTEILALPSQGVYQTKSITVVNNGTTTIIPDQNYDAIEELSLTVNVPSENLDSVITAQENKLDALEEILENKVSGNAKPNVFVQITEPNKKKGLWLQINGTAEHYVCDSDVYTGGNWAPASETASIPYGFYNSAAVVIGTNIYLLGSNVSGNLNNNYKYDTLTNTYTKMTNIPYDFYDGAAVTIGTDIYLLGGSRGMTNNYKYDTLTNTYTKMTNIPYNFYDGAAVTIGTDIYLLGSWNDTNKNYKYDTLTDTYTKMTNIPYNFRASSAVAVGTDIYLLGSSYDDSTKTKNYKYDTLTDTYTQLTNIPYQFYNGSAAAVGNDIYIFGGEGGDSNNTKNYKYNTLLDTYTQMTNIPYAFRYGSAVTIGTDIYLLGGNNSSTTNRKYIVSGKSYETDNTVVIQNGSTYYTELFETNFEEGYKPTYGLIDAFFYTEQGGLDGTMPVYYGNGTQWVNIKNPPSNS